MTDFKQKDLMEIQGITEPQNQHLLSDGIQTHQGQFQNQFLDRELVLLLKLEKKMMDQNTFHGGISSQKTLPQVEKKTFFIKHFTF